MRRAILFIAAVGLGACADDDPRPATIAYIAPAILRPSCATASCHSRAAAASGLILEGNPATIRADLVARSVLHPRHPDASPLVHLLRGDFTALRMPPDRPLPEMDILLIERWIAEGAP
jgi:hypothetical protein